MYLCPQCSGQSHRSRRNWLEKITCTAAFRCDACDLRFTEQRFAREPHAVCPKCRSSNLTILRSPDLIDEMDLNPFRNMQRLFGAKLYHCWRCRLQFYDLRTRQLKNKDKETETKFVTSA